MEFRDVLDEKLAGVRPGWQSAAPARRTGVVVGAMPAPALLFASGASLLGADARPAARSAYSPHTVPPPASRPPRRLSAADARAVEALRGFGAAGLDDDFSDADLKRAYRVLARRFHPDVHPTATDAERAYLAHAFGRITAAYQQLSHAAVS